MITITYSTIKALRCEKEKINTLETIEERYKSDLSFGIDAIKIKDLRCLHRLSLELPQEFNTYRNKDFYCEYHKFYETYGKPLEYLDLDFDLEFDFLKGKLIKFNLKTIKSILVKKIDLLTVNIALEKSFLAENPKKDKRNLKRLKFLLKKYKNKKEYFAINTKITIDAFSYIYKLIFYMFIRSLSYLCQKKDNIKDILTQEVLENLVNNIVDTISKNSHLIFKCLRKDKYNIINLKSFNFNIDHIKILIEDIKDAMCACSSITKCKIPDNWVLKHHQTINPVYLDDDAQFLMINDLSFFLEYFHFENNLKYFQDDIANIFAIPRGIVTDIIYQQNLFLNTEIYLSDNLLSILKSRITLEFYFKNSITIDNTVYKGFRFMFHKIYYVSWGDTA